MKPYTNDPKYKNGIPVPSMFNNDFYTGVSGMKTPIPEDRSRQLQFAQMAHNPFARPYSSAKGWEDPSDSHTNQVRNWKLDELAKTDALNAKRQEENIQTIKEGRNVPMGGWSTIKSSLNYPNGYRSTPDDGMSSGNPTPATIPPVQTAPTTTPPTQMPTEAEIRSGVQRPAPLYSTANTTPQFNANAGVVQPIAKPYGTYQNTPDDGMDAVARLSIPPISTAPLPTTPAPTTYPATTGNNDPFKNFQLMPKFDTKPKDVVQEQQPEAVDVPWTTPRLPTSQVGTVPPTLAYPGTRGYGAVQMPTAQQVSSDAFPVARDKGVQEQQPYPESTVQMPSESEVRSEAFPSIPVPQVNALGQVVAPNDTDVSTMPEGMIPNMPWLGLNNGSNYTTQPNLQNGTPTLDTPTANGQLLTTTDIPPATNQPTTTGDATIPNGKNALSNTTTFNGLPSLLASQGVPYENARNATQVPPAIDPSDPYGLRNRAAQRMGFPYPGANDMTTPTDGTTPAAKDATANTQNRLPYFDLIKTIDMTALARNMAQGPPPSMQNPITHMPRVHYDRTIFDTQRQQIAEGSNRAQYEARQQLGQAGDFQQMMLGINAQQQQAGQQVGLQERDMRMQELNQNAQISGQEQTMQDQQNLQEAQMNYQIQQQAQMAKDQAVSQGLGNIKNDVMQETQYNESKNTIAKQEAIDLQHREDQKKIGMMTLGMQMEDVWDETPEYQQGLNQSYLTHQAETNSKVLGEMQGDPLWKDRVGDIKEYSTTTHTDTDKLAKTYEGKIDDWNKEQDLKTAEHADKTARLADLNEKLPTLTGSELEAAKQNIAGYEQRLGALGDEMESNRANVDAHQTEIDKLHNNSEVFGEMKKRFTSSYDLSGAAKKYREKARGESEMLRNYEDLKKYLGI